MIKAYNFTCLAKSNVAPSIGPSTSVPHGQQEAGRKGKERARTSSWPDLVGKGNEADDTVHGIVFPCGCQMASPREAALSPLSTPIRHSHAKHVLNPSGTLGDHDSRDHIGVLYSKSTYNVSVTEPMKVTTHERLMEHIRTMPALQVWVNINSKLDRYLMSRLEDKIRELQSSSPELGEHLSSGAASYFSEEAIIYRLENSILAFDAASAKRDSEYCQDVEKGVQERIARM